MNRLVALATEHRIVIGLLMLALGIGASVWLAFAASSETPPNGAQSALLVIVGGLLNLGGAWAVSRRPGDPNLTTSRVVIRHLARITIEAAGLVKAADKAFESREKGDREDLGQLSWRLSDLHSRLVQNVDDWARAYPDLVEDLHAAASADSPGHAASDPSRTDSPNIEASAEAPEEQ